MKGQQFLESGIFTGGEDQCENTGFTPRYGSSLMSWCLSQHTSIEVSILFQDEVGAWVDRCLTEHLDSGLHLEKLEAQWPVSEKKLFWKIDRSGLWVYLKKSQFFIEVLHLLFTPEES